MKTGTYQDLSNDDYHADMGSISTSLIKTMLNSYATAKYNQTKKQTKPSPAMILGTTFHKLVLEPLSFNNEIVIGLDIDKRSKANKEAHASFEAMHQGKLIITQDIYDTAVKMRDSAFKHPKAKTLLVDGIAEQSIFWDFSEKIQLRCRPDYVNKDNVIVDLKSAVDASPLGFAKAVANFRYDLQQAIYEDGYPDNTGFVFVVTETKAPYLTAVYRLKSQDIARARETYNSLLNGWDACLEFNEFTGYGDDVIDFELPGWMK